MSAVCTDMTDLVASPDAGIERRDSSCVGMTQIALRLGMKQRGQRALCRAMCQLTVLPH